MTDLAARAIAFYLPQFHPVAENDAWWGRGFTEWTNVVRTRARFPGHHQPQLPGELGYYDLRVPEVREQQAALARSHGIEGFCYYHYWFRGRRVLDRVFREVLETGRPDFPFCLCWANEPWTRVWDGGDRQVLMPQEYDEQDDLEHIRVLIEAFRDPRYITVGGRPLLLVYRVQALTDASRTLELWRTECRAAGVAEPFIVKFDTHGNFEDPATYGCQAAAQFLPHGVAEAVPTTGVPGSHPGNHTFHYDDIVDAFLPEAGATRPAWTRFPSVFPGWDNSSRRPDGESLIVVGNTPGAYQRWLTGAVERATTECFEPIVFINAWNEWAEGAHLEPDERFGRAFLEATARVLLGAEPSPEDSIPVMAHHPMVTGPTFAELYLDLYEDYIRLQRYTTGLIASVERRVQREVDRRDQEIVRAQSELTDLAAHARRLQTALDRATGAATAL